MEQVDTHTIDPTFWRGGWVLDVGCRGFAFAKRLVDLGCQVLALDPDKQIKDPQLTKVTFDCCALTGKHIERATYATWSTGEGNHLCIGRPIPNHATSYQVDCITITELMAKYSIQEWEVVKLDCEGAEYDILLNWPGPIAKQISVEFHDFTGANPYNPPELFYQKMLAHLGEWYVPKQHKKLSHPCGIIGYWDSLFVRK